MTILYSSLLKMISFEFVAVTAIKNIGTAYGLSIISWQGDPCVPRGFLWDGLNCSDTEGSTPPRITSL